MGEKYTAPMNIAQRCIAGFSIFFLTATSVSAGDPLENYDEFVPTGRGNAEYENICREELGILMGVQPVGAQRYNLRRCVNNKRAQADKERITLRQQRARRQKMESEEVQKARSLRFKAGRARERFLRKKQSVRKTFRQKPRTRSEIMGLRRERAKERAEIQMKERERLSQTRNARGLRRRLRAACAGIRDVEQRKECQAQQRHNLNTMEGRE